MECTKIELVEMEDLSPRAIGEPVDLVGRHIRVYYDDGSTGIKEIAVNMVDDSARQSRGPERKVVVRYERQKLPLSLRVLPISLTGIQAHIADGAVFTEGMSVDSAMFRVLAFYDDESSREVKNFKFFPYIPLTTKDDAITIKYGRFSVQLPIVVSPAHLENEVEQEAPVIADTDGADDAFGLHTEQPDLSSQIEPVMDIEPDTEDEEIVPPDPLPVSPSRIGQSSEPLSRTPIHLDPIESPEMPEQFSAADIERLTQECPSERTLMGIYVSEQTRSEYDAGEPFDLETVTVKAVYSDEYEEIVSAEVSPSGPLEIGAGHVVVTYMGKSAIVLIHVNPAPATAADAGSAPSDTEAQPSREDSVKNGTNQVEPDWNSDMDWSRANGIDFSELGEQTRQEELESGLTGNLDFYPSTIELRFAADVSKYL